MLLLRGMQATTDVRSSRLSDPCKSKEIGYLEVAISSQSRPPLGVLPQVRHAVALQQPDDHLRDDATSYRPERCAARPEFRLLQDVVPERCLLIEVERPQLGQLLPTKLRNAHCRRHSLAGG